MICNEPGKGWSQGSASRKPQGNQPRRHQQAAVPKLWLSCGAAPLFVIGTLGSIVTQKRLKHELQSSQVNFDSRCKSWEAGHCPKIVPLSSNIQCLLTRRSRSKASKNASGCVSQPFLILLILFHRFAVSWEHNPFPDIEHADSHGRWGQQAESVLGFKGQSLLTHLSYLQ